jgi:hypothetical protein
VKNRLHIIFLFVDGVGLGADDPNENPLVAAHLPALCALTGGPPTLRHRRFVSDDGGMISLDATMGVPGLPQSGTGQAALLGGFNAPRKAKQHFGPFPPTAVRASVERHNIFRRVLEAGLKPCFVTAFPQRFFDYMNQHKRPLSMTTMSCQFAGMPLRQEAELREGEGLSADLTSEGWREMGYADMPILTLEESGRRLAELGAKHDFTLFEYWKTDFAGHARNIAESIAVLERFDGMLHGLIGAVDKQRALIVLSSDHGNIENLTVKTHTRNPVPLVAYGARAPQFLADVAARSRPTLAHVVPAMMKLLTAE